MEKIRFFFRFSKTGFDFWIFVQGELLPHYLSMTWSKKNENWSKIVGGERFWKRAQKRTKTQKNGYNSKTIKKFEKISKAITS